MRIAALLLTTLLACTVGSAHAAPRDTAQQLIDHLQAGRTDAAEAMFTAQMAAAVPADRLKVLWDSLGALQSRGEPQITEQQGMQVVAWPLQFANGAVIAQVVVDAQDKVAGLMLRPAPPTAAPPVPPQAGYSEVAFDVPQARGALPGTLAVPQGKGPFPGVVLVHGSGPQDRDETIGGSRPFLDIARALAAQGIAVLRYEKRSHAHPEQFQGSFSIDDETTDDAVAAVAALAEDARVDGARVFVLGHSLGGMMAPRIASRAAQARGAILWAAPARDLLALLAEQNRYLLGLDGSISSEEQAFLDTLDAQIAAARSSAPATPAQLPLGVPQAYWHSLLAVDARAEAKALGKPMLMLQGGRDFQVPDTDWTLWQQALQGRTDVQWQRFAELNHLGIAGTGASSLQEYGRAGHVDTRLVDAVAGWVKAQR